MGRKRRTEPQKERLVPLVLAERQAIQARLTAFHQRGAVREREDTGGDNTPVTDFIDVANEGAAKVLEAVFTGVLVARLKALDQAAGRIQKGIYGVCETCGEPIPAARLRALPEATLCVPCAEKAEQRRPAPSRRAG